MLTKALLGTPVFETGSDTHNMCVTPERDPAPATPPSTSTHAPVPLSQLPEY